jgi:hypothetical protein
MCAGAQTASVARIKAERSRKLARWTFWRLIQQRDGEHVRKSARSSPRAFGHAFAPVGKRTVKTEPLPGSLVTVTAPPIMRASLRERARPSPVPP